MSLIERLIKNASYSVMAGMTTAVGAFTAGAIVARTLGVEGMASVAMALWIVFFATTICDVGVTGSLARFATHEKRTGGGVGVHIFVWDRFKALLIAIAFGLLLTGIVLTFYWSDIVEKYSNGRREAYLICSLIFLCFIVHMLFAYCYQYLRGSLEFRVISRYAMIGSVLQIIAVFIGSHQFGVVGALAGYVLASVPMLLVLSRLRVADAAPSAVDRKIVRRYAVTFYISALFSPLLWVRADLLLVDQIAGANAVGLFAAASTVAALLMQVCQMVCNALLPNILRAAAEEPGSLQRVSATVTRFGLFAVLPACFIGAALAPDAIDLVYGAAFRNAGPTAALLGCAAAASAITLVLSGVLNATDSNAVLVRSGMVGAALTIVFGIAFISKFGLIGAAIGRLGAQSVVAAINIVAANRVVPNLVKFGWFSRYFFVSATAGLAAWMTSNGDGVLVLLRSGLAGTLTFLIMTILSLRFVRDDREAVLRFLAGQAPGVRRAAALFIGRMD